MAPWRKITVGLLALIACLATAYITWRVALLERSEFTEETEKSTLETRMHAEHATRISARLASVQIAAEQFAVFELCAVGDLSAPAWHGAFDIAVLHLDASKLMLRVPLDAAHLAHVKKNAAGSCLFLGSGLIEHGGTYSVEAVWKDQPPTAAAVLKLPLVLRISVKTPLSRSDYAAIAGLGALLLAGIILLMLSTNTRRDDLEHMARRTVPRAAIFGVPLGALALVCIVMQWPSEGPLQTVFKGLLLLLMQCALSLAAARALQSELGLLRPRVRFGWLAAVAAWPTLIFSARLALRVIPSTGEAPLQTFISWPSGMLAAALLGVLLPVGEELFFRGLLFGAWSRVSGGSGAFLASTLAFGALHAQQSWGNWGGLLAVFLTGALLCTLRWWSGSTWLALLSHVAYNLTLSLISINSALQDPNA